MNFKSHFQGKLKLSSPSFRRKDMNAEADKLFDQTARYDYNNFIIHPEFKNFTDFQRFIEFIPPYQDFDKLPNKKKRKAEKTTRIHPAIVQAFYIKQKAMNDLESQTCNENFISEIAGNSFQALEKMGRCLSGLYVEKIKQGSNGKYLIYMVDLSGDLEAKYKDCPFEIDDQVAFCNVEFSPSISAVGNVYQKLNHGIIISIDGSQINETIHSRFQADKPFCLIKQEYHAAFKVNSQTLEKLEQIMKYQESLLRKPPKFPPRFCPPQQLQACTPLLEDLLRENLDDKENEVDKVDAQDIVLLDQRLNEDQKRAVKAALAAKSVYLIDGPAGTGKTRVLAEVIHQCVKKGLKVLACGPSVYAVDNLIGRILDKNVKACRIGKSGNDDDRLSMDTLLNKNKRIGLIQDECDLLLTSFKITEHKVFLERMEENAKIAKRFQTKVSNAIVDFVDVVFSTLQGTGGGVLEQNKDVFDVLIIDECSQATEISAWAAILKSKKLIIAGDRLQLPPFIHDEEAKKLGLNFTLFDRLRKDLPESLRQILRVQYRMNEKIMEWSNEQFYKGKLIANDVCAQYTLQEYLKESSQIKQDKVPVLMLVDTSGGTVGFKEKRGKSYSNIGEAAVVLELLEHLLENYDLKREEIGVISPYQDQDELITKAIGLKSDLRGIKCQTVDYFQGKEKEVIIISLVRSNKDKIVGFLDDSRRMNVAVTRAKRFVAIVCDTSTICKPELPYLMKLIDYFKKSAEVLSPDDFKGVGYHMKFLHSIMNGGIEPFENKKSEAKVMKNMNTMEQACPISQDLLRDKEIEEEEKIQIDFKTQNASRNTKTRNSVITQNMMNLSPTMDSSRISLRVRSENTSDVDMNYYSHWKNEWKEKKKKEQASGFQIQQEDFPELGRGV